MPSGFTTTVLLAVPRNSASGAYSFTMPSTSEAANALVLETWTKAFAASDVDGIVKLYAPDALFLGTASKTVVVKPEGIRSYFENALLNNRPRGATLNNYETMVVSDAAVVI